MSPSEVVYQKTAAGADALARRDPALSPRLRTLLILVDGKRSASELARQSGASDGGAELLAQLQALGMVEPAPSARAAVASAPAPLAATTASPEELAQARRVAVRRLTDLLGPGAEELCLRIEAARTPQDLLAVLKRAESVLREFGGAQMATSFHQEMQARHVH